MHLDAIFKLSKGSNRKIYGEQQKKVNKPQLNFSVKITAKKC